MTGDIPCEDQLESLGKCAAQRPTVACEGGKDFIGFELPHLQRLVMRRGRALPVPRHCHRNDTICVAGEGAARGAYGAHG